MWEPHNDLTESIENLVTAVMMSTRTTLLTNIVGYQMFFNFTTFFGNPMAGMSSSFLKIDKTRSFYHRNSQTIHAKLIPWFPEFFLSRILLWPDGQFQLLVLVRRRCLFGIGGAPLSTELHPPLAKKAREKKCWTSLTILCVCVLVFV